MILTLTVHFSVEGDQWIPMSENLKILTSGPMDVRAINKRRT